MPTGRAVVAAANPDESMTSSYLRLTAEPHARADDLEAIQNAIHRYNMSVVSDWSYCRVVYLLRDDADRIHGGLIGGIWGGWLHVQYLWVADGLRGQGYGTQLLRAAEDEAWEKGCRGVFLETHSFQALPFYQHRGYDIAGELADYPPGHAFYVMRKLLARDGDGAPAPFPDGAAR
jgi:GNAT superfamily N-acetyltransferase